DQHKHKNTYTKISYYNKRNPRRAWAGNEGAAFQAKAAMDRERRLRVTMPIRAQDNLVEEAIRGAFGAD
ncbi:MAG: hypothetical protein MUF54_05775, partial [Polyangiaceae bacterium]|nr:hypothetical protein [Polyangiaceae bacterium]